MSDKKWIREAIRLAAVAKERGDEPFCALLIDQGVPVLAARNAVVTTGNVTQHAELRLISKSASRPITIDGPLLEDEARIVHEGFW